MAKRDPIKDHVRIANGLRRGANRAQHAGDNKLRHKYLKLLLEYQLLNFDKQRGWLWYF